jgi:uncharacterized protein YrzB (UPF0473 family)
MKGNLDSDLTEIEEEILEAFENCKQFIITLIDDEGIESTCLVVAMVEIQSGTRYVVLTEFEEGMKELAEEIDVTVYKIIIEHGKEIFYPELDDDILDEIMEIISSENEDFDELE